MDVHMSLLFLLFFVYWVFDSLFILDFFDFCKTLTHKERKLNKFR